MRASKGQSVRAHELMITCELGYRRLRITCFVTLEGNVQRGGHPLGGLSSFCRDVHSDSPAPRCMARSSPFKQGTSHATRTHRALPTSPLLTSSSFRTCMSMRCRYMLRIVFAAARRTCCAAAERCSATGSHPPLHQQHVRPPWIAFQQWHPLHGS